MIEIIPAILPKDYDDLKNNIALVRGIVNLVQIDICDGIFVKSVTWPFYTKTKLSKVTSSLLDEHFNKIMNEEEGMPFWEDIDFELDLMVMDAVENFDIYTKLGVKRIIFHIEAVGDLKEFEHFLEGIDLYVREMIEIGVAINPSTSIEKVFPLIQFIDFVQCMGNDKLGYHGVSLNEKIYNNIKILREKYPNLIISIDIGVNMMTISDLVKAGANKLVIGGAIFNSDDIRETVENFQNIE